MIVTSVILLLPEFYSGKSMAGQARPHKNIDLLYLVAMRTNVAKRMMVRE